jgi:hypothetical protein
VWDQTLFLAACRIEAFNQSKAINLVLAACREAFNQSRAIHTAVALGNAFLVKHPDTTRLAVALLLLTVSKMIAVWLDSTDLNLFLA